MDKHELQQLFHHWTPPMPSRPESADGSARRIGVELEMIGLDVVEVSRDGKIYSMDALGPAAADTILIEDPHQ